jgi:hypothetical protein
MQPSTEFLTPEECAEVDKALLTSHDKFTARTAIYSLRSLRQVSQQSGVAVADLNPHQIAEWVGQDPALRPEDGFDSSFKSFFSRLVISSMKPLRQISLEAGVPIEDLTVPQVVSWFEKEAKLRMEQGRGEESLN